MLKTFSTNSTTLLSPAVLCLICIWFVAFQAKAQVAKPTFGTAVKTNDFNVVDNAVTGVDEDQFVCAYQDETTIGGPGEVIVGTGSTFGAGTPVSASISAQTNVSCSGASMVQWFHY